ncbi:probable methyltransferase TARBP1 isoform X1 [Oncorhynchus tshawytscha]|uniref:tRNA (guanosine(18)-2'-O)-methyltransferase TARBP1 n=1 Tax=Oncorhynchus tshawytscha TaxID=74940 RepID=A0AAZ3PWB8_ONCTS|nr:probable methyltransferase TARBP1 isoform X1 [Oncorhynchus tshawytscha]
MSSILINALLSSCHDPDTLFNTLRWPTDSWPDTERVEALTTFIDGIGKLPQSDTSDDGDKVAFSIAKRDIFLRKVESIIWTQCLPLLLKVSNGDGACKGKRVPDGRAEITIAVCRLLSVCINTLCDTAVSGRVARAVLPSFQLPDGETEEELPGQGEGRLGIDVAIEALSVILPALSSNEELTTSILSSALSCIKTLPDALVSKITVRLIFTLLNCYSEDGIASKLRFILEDLCSWHKSDSSNTDSPVVTERALLCLTTLSDYLFSPAKLQQHTLPQSLSYTRPDPRRSLQFWRILQDGLTHKDNVSRKRALYLLKRCVALSEDEAVEFPSSSVSSEDNEEIIFRWAPDRCKLLREFWEDYALVMETLEENQIHVVRPVLNRIHTLIQTAANDSQGVSLFHPSWLLGVYQRMFHSENKSVMREGVDHLLELQVLRRPAFSLAFSQFILGPFMDVMSESSLFHRTAGQSVGECPELGVKLQVFMVTFFSSLPQENRGPVLLQLVQRLGSQHWCAVPILFLSRALSHLPPCPLLGPDGLQALREVLRCTMITHQVLLRGAAQCFLLNSALSLTDVTLVTLDDVFSLLVHFRADESLRRGTPLWNQLCDWLADSEGSFRPCVRESADGTSTSPEGETVRGYIQQQMELFLRVPASTDQTDSVPDPGEAELLAKAILLCVDIEGRTQRSGGEQTTGVSGGMDSLLRPLLDTLSRLHTNVYLPLRKTDKSLQLLLRLLQLTPARHTPAAVLQLTPARHTPAAVEKEQEDSVTVSMETMVLGVVEPIQEFILRRLSGELQELCDVERAELYLSVLKEVVLMYSVLEWNHSKVQEAYFPRLLRYVLRTLEADQIPSVAGQVSRAVAMASLAMTCEVAALGVFNLQSETTILLVHLSSYFYSPAPPPAPPLSLVNFNQTLLKPPTAAQSTGVSEQGPLLKDWGRMAAHFIRDQWTCLGYWRRIGPPGPLELPRASGSLQAAIEALSLLPSGLVLPVLDFMASMLPQVALSEEALCVEAVTVSWKLVLGLSSNPHDFWPTLQGFVTMAFHHSLLELTKEQAPGLTVTLQQIAVELMDLSQAKTGVFNVLIQHCCHTWLPSDPGSEGQSQSDAMFSSALLHLDILAEACVYGPVFRRDQRLIQEVQVYVERLGEECAANTAVPSDNRDDQFPRVCVVAFLSRLQPSNQLHERLMEELVLCLLKKDEAISKSKQRYYSNSLQHRVKNRVWQTLLMLLPKLRGEFVGTVLGRVFEAGFVSNQASVKYLIEWKMVLILVQYPEHIDRLWACFSVDQEKTKTSVCTFLSVLVHLNIIMPQLKEKAVQWRKALDVILQWCFSHNFSVRLYALLALKRVWGLEGARAEAEEGAGGADGLGGLATVVKACLHQAEAMQSTGNASKNWSRIQDHFFFGVFHPVRDYSVETIFYTFPSLSEVFEDEWIPPWKFEKLVDFSQSASLPLRNPVPDLSQIQPGDWIQQDKGDQDGVERWAEVQKKMTPWRLGIQEQEPELGLVPQQRAARLGKLHSALLVVASLIDKPTNLGGLCRTCEIFGASALVLDSLRHVSDKHFQALSVSSELWLPLLEVKPVELADFLQLKKREGYCIVGVEQTANSQSLKDYKFPVKTLLLLGNEREGIPANLLQLLDVCVEIPQQGVIRSLNVHVSAALLVWEYTRQYLPSTGVKSD